MSAAAPDAYWCELAWLGGETAERGVVVEVEGERIAAVEAGVAAPPAGATRLEGLTLPGFANAHSHAFHRALRGNAERGGGSFWTWREDMYEVAARLDPQSYFRLARAAFGEMALAGITAVGEFHYLHHAPGGAPYADPNELGRVAARRGARGGNPDHAARHVLPPRRHRRAADRTAAALRRRRRCRLGGPCERARRRRRRSGSAPRSTASARSSRTSAARSPPGPTAAERPLHAHVSEQPAENEACHAAYGRRRPRSSPRRERWTSASSPSMPPTSPTPTSPRSVAPAAPVALCPTTERSLADGVGPARALIDAGAGLALGTDSHAVIDLLEEARAVELDERLVERRSAATTMPLRCCGRQPRPGTPRSAGATPAAWRPGRSPTWSRCGSTASGSRERARIAPSRRRVFAATAADVDRVISGGREIVRDGEHAQLDVPAS